MCVCVCVCACVRLGLGGDQLLEEGEELVRVAPQLTRARVRRRRRTHPPPACAAAQCGALVPVPACPRARALEQVRAQRVARSRG